MLKPGMIENTAKVEKKIKGKSRGGPGSYNTNKATKRRDAIEFISTIFGDTVTVGEEEFIELKGGRRIHSKYKDQYLFVNTGRAPDEWVQGLIDSQMLPLATIDKSKFAQPCS